MRCDKCGFENPEGMRFCGQCATPLKLACSSCGFANPFDFEFCGQCATSLSRAGSAAKTTDSGNSSPSPNNPRPAAQPAKQQDAERRQLTVLFCDIVGSSALSERIDPEELRDIMRDYRNTCNEIISRYDGYIAQYLGDGVLVYFGYPHAHEDDAQRAAFAALEIVERIPQCTFPSSPNDPIQLAVRVGIHTGLVVVGEIGGGDKRSLALGETPNLAARLQEHAAANTVVISEASHRLLGHRFECLSLGKHSLKGFSHPITLSHVLRVRGNKNRSFSPHHASLIGREQETTLMIERLNQARKGVGQIVLLTGEPGLGKTRLVQQVCESVNKEDGILLDCYGAPYYKNSFLYPVMDMLRRIIGLHDELSTQDQLSRIEQTVATLGMDTHVVTSILAELLSIPHHSTSEEKLPNHSSTPQQKKQQALNTLVTLIQKLAQQRFVLLIVEDLQWVDPSTLELLSLLVEQPGLTNIFAIFSFRNEFNSPWKSRANLTQITLNHLTRKQSGSMIKQLCEGKLLPIEVFTEILNKTDGIPFFVEELTNAVLRSSLLIEKDQHFEISSNISELGIPTTLQDSLMSRLDDLGEDKELAQLSATLGREFSYELLHAASMRAEASLQSGITRLINAELFSQNGYPPKAQYRFQHALLREAAYQSLLKRTRQKYHQRIAGLIKEKFPHIVADNPEILAYHCTEAGNDDDALSYWLSAGRYAIQRSANIEAAAHLKEGLAIVERMPNTPQAALRELALQTSLGLAIMMSKGYAAPEAEKAYARAYALCRNIADVNTVFPVLCGLWEFYIVRANLEEAENIADELDQIASHSTMPSFTEEARRALGTTHFWKGNFSEALANLDKLIDRPEDHIEIQSSLVAYSQDARVAALANSACILWLLGKSAQAMEHGQAALNLAKRLSHPFSQAYALHFMGTLSQLCGDHQATYQYADAQIVLSETYGFAFWAATGKMLKAWSASTAQPTLEICLQFQQALKEYEDSGNRLARSYFQALLADLLQRNGQTENALQTIEASLNETKHTGEGFFTAELLRLKGVILSVQDTPNADNAEKYFTESLIAADAQGAAALALRTATSLVKHLRDSLPEDKNIATPDQDKALNMAINQLKQRISQIPEPQISTDFANAEHLLLSLREPIVAFNQLNHSRPEE